MNLTKKAKVLGVALFMALLLLAAMWGLSFGKTIDVATAMTSEENGNNATSAVMNIGSNGKCDGAHTSSTGLMGLPQNIISAGNYHLENDINATLDLTISGNITVNLCLNGNTLNMGDYAIIVESGVTLKIHDCSSSGAGLITGLGTNNGIILFNGDSLNLYDVTITDTGTARYTYAIFNEGAGKVNVSNGAISSAKGYAIYSSRAGALTISGNATIGANAAQSYRGIYMNGGSFTMTGGAIYASSQAITKTGNGTITVSAGTIYSEKEIAIYNSGIGVINISGGAISSGYLEAIYNYGAATINISGGAISATGSNAIANIDMGKIHLSGAPIITGAESGAIYIAKQNTLIANNGNANSPTYYTGNELAIKYNSSSYDIPNSCMGHIIISGVNDTNYAKFTITNARTGGCLKYKSNNLVYGIECSVAHTLTNLTATDGTVGNNAASYGETYTTTLVAATEYSLPSAIEITIFGVKVNQETDYTYLNGVITIFGEKVTGAIVITASGIINKYTITFNSNGGSSVAPITQDYNTIVTKPIDPIKTAYSFDGWYTDSNFSSAYTFSTALTKNITLYAKWTEKLTINIDETAQTVIYSGSPKFFKVSGTALKGFDVEYFVDNGYTVLAPTNAGSYTVKISRAEDETHAQYLKVIQKGLTISAKQLTVVWKGENNSNDFNYVYTGNSIVPTASVTTGVSAETVVLTVSGGAKNASISAYTATASMATSNSNFTLIGYTKEFYISKDTVTAPYDAGSKTYTGSVLKSDLSDTANYTVTANAGGTVVGEYNVVVSLIDPTNFTWATGEDTATRTIKFRITNATIINNGAFSDYSGVYDGKAHGINYDASKIIVVGGQAITVWFSEDNLVFKNSVTYTNFTSGARTVYYKLTAPNHEDITGSCNVTITKMSITVTADTKSSMHNADLVSLTYTSAALIASDSFSGALATTADEATVGEYDITIGALSAGDNYSINFIPGKYKVLAKATVTVSETPQEFTYNGLAKTFKISGTTLKGFTVKYFVGDVYTTVAPINAGSYNVEISREEDETNYAFHKEIAAGLVINREIVLAPAQNTIKYIYNGEIQTYAVTANDNYTVSNNTRKNAGVQNITIALKDTVNYQWHYASTSDITFTWRILQATLTPSVAGITAKTYDGNNSATGAISLLGAVNGEKPTASANFNWTSVAADTTTVNVANITLENNWATNYILSTTSLRNQSESGKKISKASITVTIFDQRTTKGKDLVNFATTENTYMVTDGTLVIGDDLLITLSTNADKNIAAKTTINGTAANTNYLVTFISGEYSVYSIDGFNDFMASYGDTINLTPEEITFMQVSDINAMNSDYASLDTDSLSQLTDTQKSKIATLKAKADAITIAKTAAENALDALKIITATGIRNNNPAYLDAEALIKMATDKIAEYKGLSSGLTEADLQGYASLASAQLAITNAKDYLEFEKIYSDIFVKDAEKLKFSETGDIKLIYDSFTKLSDGAKEVLTKTEKDNIKALKDKADALIAKKTAADTALKALKDAIADDAGKEKIKELLPLAKNKAEAFITENGEESELADFNALANAVDKISEYEKQEITDKIKEKLGSLEDFTPDFIGDMDIPNLESTIDKAQQAIDKIDASSDKTKDELKDKREELLNIKDNLTKKLNLENIKVGAIEKLTAEREKLLASSAYSNSAKKQIAKLYNGAIDDIKRAMTGEIIAARQETCIIDMNLVEKLHVGWLVIDIILAMLLLAEIGFLAWRKLSKNRVKKSVKTYCVSPLVLFAAIYGVGFKTGIVFFILLLIVVLTLGVWVTDRVLRDKTGKSVFSPVTDKIDKLLTKAFSKKPPQAQDLRSLDTADSAREEQKNIVSETVVKNKPTKQAENEKDCTVSKVVEFLDKKILIKYNFSFQAKLIQAPAEIQTRFGALTDELSAYSELKCSLSWRHSRYHIGRNIVALLLFRGKTLCVALAVDPKKFVGTKYHGRDMSSVKRFQDTPMLIRLTSDRKTRYAAELIREMLTAYGIGQNAVSNSEFSLPYECTDELIQKGLVKVLSNRKIADHSQTIKADISQLIRDKITLREAQGVLVDEVAAALVETKRAKNSSEKAPQAAPRGKKSIINIDTLSEAYTSGETVTISNLKKKKLITPSVMSIKILARGALDKPLIVEAQNFSIDAVKMILLTGGKVVKTM